jgi:hypothetical protein
MAIEIRCDVEGCDSLAPVSNYSPLDSTPQGWTTVILRTTATDLDRQKVKNRFSALPDTVMPFPMAMLPGAGMMRKVYCCSKHELPKFKPAESVPNDIDFVVG